MGRTKRLRKKEMETIKISPETNRQINKIIRLGFGYEKFDYLEGVSDEITLEEIEQTKRYFERKKNIVKTVLLNYPLSRNSDTVMELECLRIDFPDIQVTNGSKNIHFVLPKKDIKAIIKTPFEDYRRCRQKIIEESIKAGDKELIQDLLPTESRIRDKRQRKARVYKEFFKSQK